MREHGIKLNGDKLKNNYRNFLSLFSTGITSIVVKNKKIYEGITVNSFASVSLKPKIVIWCLDKNSRSKKNFLDKNKKYKIFFLSKKQKKVSQKLASSNNVFNDKYFNLILQECLGYMDCKLFKTYNVGDHYLVLHKVLSYYIMKKQKPLIFYKSKYLS